MFIQSGEWVTISKLKLQFKKKVLKSLKFRILVILIFVGTVPSIILKNGILSNYETRTVSTRSITVKNQLDILCNQISSNHYLVDSSSPVINAELTQIANLYEGRILILNDKFRIVKDTYAMDENKIIATERGIKAFKGEDNTYYNKKIGFIELAVTIKDDVTKEPIGVMMAWVSTNAVVDSLDSLNQKAIILLLVLGIGVLAIGFLLAGIVVKPFASVTKSIEELTDGYMDEKISIPDYTETQLISEAFNKVLARMKTLDDSRQEFVSNVSHELKTPLTSMKVLADSLIAQENVPPELYHEFLTDIAAEIDRENKIINDLLSLVKLDKKSNDLKVEEVNINELIGLILKRLRPIAEKQNIELVLESFRPVVAEVDEVKLTLAISNLVENAIKYNHQDGWVHVSLNADHKYFYIKVADSGLGIPEESMEHVFERFYRVDKSHSREIGGTGLGLAITRNAILMHRGAIKVYSKEEEGTTFTVRVPLNYIA
ncbi:MAG TPA: ATP-binding protein [Candidatus Merdenecus merdavium]|nr:ATP-binding protein [Candidatus Merdenecus merdavium]